MVDTNFVTLDARAYIMQLYHVRYLERDGISWKSYFTLSMTKSQDMHEESIYLGKNNNSDDLRKQNYDVSERIC